MDVAAFENLFEKVPNVNVYSQKDVRDRIQHIKKVINSNDENWEERNKGLQEIRSLLANGHLQGLEDLPQTIRSLDAGLQTTLKDLRSQVCREACITVAYMAQKLGNKFESSSEMILPILIQLIQNTFRIITLSSITCAKYIFKYVQHSRLVGVLASNLSNKSPVIRKHCCEFMMEILSEWDKGSVEKVVVVTGEFIRKGVSDADAEARMFSRKCFAVFSEMFPDQGYAILCSLEPAKQKQLLAQMENTNPLKTSVPPTTPAPVRKTVRPRDPQTEAVPRTPRTLPKPSTIPVTPNRAISCSRTTMTLARCRPDVDSVKKLRTLQTPKYRDKVVQSQPSSRAASPGMAMLNTPDVTSTTRSRPGQHHFKSLRPSKRPGVCQSQTNSRDASPVRCRIGRGFESPALSSRHGIRKPVNRRGHDDFGRNLDHAVNNVWRSQVGNRGGYEDLADGMSETSSICSDHSYKSTCAVNERLREVLSCMTSSSWSDRQESVCVLHQMVSVEGAFNASELKSVLRCMTKLLHDPHPKVFNTSLDCLRDLFLTYHQQMSDWLPSIFNRLLSKSGSEVLSYQHDKILAALNAIRDSFPEDLQFATLSKFIVDQPQSINPKLKSTVLVYLSEISQRMNSNNINNNSDTRLSLSKIACWSNEPKNANIRKLAQTVLSTLHANTQPTFSKILTTLPRTLQESVKKVVGEDGVGDSGGGGVTPSRRRSLSRNNGGSSYGNNNNNYGNNNLQNNNNNYYNNKGLNKNFTNNNGNNNIRSQPYHSNGNNNIATQNYHSNGNDNISDVILKAAEELQSLSVADDDADVCNYLNKNPADWDSDDLGMLLEEIRSADEQEQWCRLMVQLSEVAGACGVAETWESHFKMVLLLLLEAMQDQDANKRSASLKVLKALLHLHSYHFLAYTELTVMNLLEFEKEPDREIQKQYEECTAVLCKVIPHHHLIPMLRPVSMTALYPLNMGAIKVLTKVVNESEGEDVKDFVGEIIPALVLGFENSETSVRKASMVCLLAVHKHIGPDLMPLLKELNSSKIKLLSLYIKRGSNTEDSAVAS